MNAEPRLSGSEAQFCFRLYRKGESVERVRELIRISDSHKKYLEKMLTPPEIAAAITHRENILAQFEKLLLNPTPLRSRKRQKHKNHSKIPESTKESIRAALQAEPDTNLTALAKRFGVNAQSVYDIRDQLRDQTPHVGRSSFSEEDVQQIDNLLRQGIPCANIAARFGVSGMTIRRVRTTILHPDRGLNE